MKGSELLGNKQDSIHYLNPRILKYNLPNNHLRTPNTSFFKSKNGVLYIGKENGILVLDGSSNFFTAIEGPVHIGSSGNGIIHYLASNDLGTIEYTPHQGIQISSHINDINSHYALFIPYNLTVNDSLLILATSAGVFVNHGEEYQHFFFKRKECKLITTDNNIFLDCASEGLFVWKDTSFVIALNSTELDNKRVTSIFESDTQFKINTTHGTSFVSNKAFENLIKSKTCSINGNDIYQMETLPNRNHLVSTEGDLVYIFSDENGLLNAPGESGVLPNSPIKSTYIDEFNDIWLLYAFELYKLEYPSHIYSLDLPKGVAGNVLNSIVSGEYIYLGTQNGLVVFRTVENEKWEWTARQQINDEYINLFNDIGNTVFAGGNESLYEIIGDKPIRIDKGKFSGLAPESKDLIYACKEEGLTKYSKENNSWNSTIVDHSLSYVLDMNWFLDRIWLITENNKIVSFNTVNEKLTEFVIPADKANHLKIINNQLFLIGEHNLWVWNEKKQEFNKHEDKDLSITFLNSDIISLGHDITWIVEHQDKDDFNIYTYDQKNGLIPFHGVSPSHDFYFINGINQSENYLWLTGEDQLLRVNLHNYSDTLKNTVRIEKVCKYSTETQCKIIENNEDIPFSKDIIKFSLDNLRYQNDPFPYYRYRLNNYQNEWSEWSQEKQIRISGLKERKYTFEAQSRTISGGVSNTVFFQFSVNPPFYRTWYAYLIYGLILVISVFLILKWRLLSLQHVESRAEAEIKDKMDTLIIEKEKSDKLVNNMFPKGTAEELKAKGRAKSEKYELATVLFSDIQGFTKIAEEMNPEILIDELDKFFFHFDSVVEKHNIEKIKTIGDAYMAAGGIPIKNSTNPVEVVLAGLEMQQYMNDLKKSKTDIWDLRIGIHSGPVISGVVGHKKLSYDIWGDTVNTASRMESSGEGGKVNISGVTYLMVKDYFLCEYRGKLPVKYKGNIDMYFVTGLRPELSVDLQGIPNRRFFLKLQILRMRDLENRVFNDLLGEYPRSFHFHTRDHIKQIYNQTELLCRAENITEEDTLLILSASLLLYAGINESYEHFESKSVVIARELLPEISYSEKQIDAICNLILATKTPYKPQNKLESILIDAKMEYLGRPNFSRLIKLLYLELKSNEREIPMQKLIKEHIAILKEFKYFTVAGQRLREVSGEDQIKALENG